MAQCSAFDHTIKWFVIALVFQASMVSADLEVDVSSTTEETTATTANRKNIRLNGFLDQFEETVNGPLEQILMHPVCLIIATSSIVCWHIINGIVSITEAWKLKDSPNRLLVRFAKTVEFANYWIQGNSFRTGWQGVMILQFYFSPYIQRNFSFIHEAPFMSSCFLLFFDAAFCWFVWNVFIKRIMKITPEAPATTKKMKVKNVYMKISVSLHRVSVYFFVQLALIMFYIYALNDVESWKPDSSDDKGPWRPEDAVSYWRWLVAILLTVIAGEDEVGATFDDAFWDALISEKLGEQPTNCLWCCNTTLRTQWQLRRFYSWSVNLVFRQIVLGTAPVMLSVSDPLEFIRDALAVFFITKLDDVEDGKSLGDAMQELVEHLKYMGYENLEEQSEAKAE